MIVKVIYLYIYTEYKQTQVAPKLKGRAVYVVFNTDLLNGSQEQPTTVSLLEVGTST